jgi:hypothetical protein
MDRMVQGGSTSVVSTRPSQGIGPNDKALVPYSAAGAKWVHCSQSPESRLHRLNPTGEQMVEYRTRWSYAILIVIPLLCCYALALANPSDDRRVTVYAGGVAGITDLLASSNSEIYRSKGGGLYLHNSGWEELTSEQKRQILRIFHGNPLALEFGFGSGAAWGDVYATHYQAFNVHPDFIAVNAFSSNNHPTAEQWSSYSARLRDKGVPPATLILPTFEYQNFRSNIASLSQNQVHQSSVFQAIIQSAGGIVLDTPSGYSMKREPAYRDWVVDAIHWTKQRGLRNIVILSPGPSEKWAEDTFRYVQYLRSHDAIPSAFICENYDRSKSMYYPNRVGRENNPDNTLGHCLTLVEAILPHIKQNDARRSRNQPSR